ncbi:DMT family transporter [bacterium]|nr:DMT family transporter [bacterium]
MHPFAYPVISALLWSVATQFFAKAGRAMPIRRLNLIKSWVSFALFAIVCLLSSGFASSLEAVGWLCISGIVGFALGDLLIFASFSRMGPARTMIIGSFQPAIIALFSFVFFSRTLNPKQYLGIALMILCIVILSSEKKRRSDVTWKTLLLALAGMSLDALGVVFTKQAFSLDPSIDAFTANFYRIGIAIPVMTVINYKTGFWRRLKDTPRPALLGALVGTLLGTFLALYFYLAGIAKADAPTIAALTLCAPLIASAYEHFKERLFPSGYFLLAVATMLTGVFILIKN